MWTLQVGTTGNDTPLDADTQFRIGSVTKTFTAVLVLLCRDDGLLDLDDPVGAHLDVRANGELTILRLLSHTAGLQREPHGDVWDTLAPPQVEQLIADLARVERVLPPARRYHCSNLGPPATGQGSARPSPRLTATGCGGRRLLARRIGHERLPRSRTAVRRRPDGPVRLPRPCHPRVHRPCRGRRGTRARLAGQFARQ